MRSIGACSLFALLLTCAGMEACTHRSSGELNVDEIQGQVSRVEGHLRGMRRALSEKDFDRASDSFEEAKEAFDDHQESLAAYPEIDELRESVQQAESTLCFQAVNLALESLFAHIRQQDLSGAGDELERAKSEHARCQTLIADLPDYMPLKMNLDSAPQALLDLEKVLARPALLARMEQAKAPMRKMHADVIAKLKQLKATPKHRDLAVAIDSGLKALSEELAKARDFSAEPEWAGFASKLTGELAELHKARAALVRRGKLLMISADRLPAAEAQTVLAAAAKDRDQAKKQLNEALAVTQKCQHLLAEVVKQEPGLSKFKIRFKGRQRSVAWLSGHVRKKVASLERMIAKLSGKQVKPAPKKPEKKKKKKKKRRKRRVRRW